MSSKKTQGDEIFLRACNALGIKPSNVALGLALGIDGSNISRWIKSGDFPPKHLATIVKKTGKSLSWLKTGKEAVKGKDEGRKNPEKAKIFVPSVL